MKHSGMVDLLPAFAGFHEIPEAAQILFDIAAKIDLVKRQILHKTNQLLNCRNVVLVPYLADGGMHQLGNRPALASLDTLHNARFRIRDNLGEHSAMNWITRGKAVMIVFNVENILIFAAVVGNVFSV